MMLAVGLPFVLLLLTQSLWLHGLQLGRLPCPSPSPAACSNSCPSSQWCHPTISSFVVSFSCLQSLPASGSFPVSWKYCSFSISPSNEYSVLSSFRIDWFDILAVQGTLKSLLQHQNSEASILWHSACFTIQLLYLYSTTGKTITLTRWTFVSKVMSLLFIISAIISE